MDDQPIMTRPISSSEKLLRDKFYERYATQSDLMDRLAQQLITVELAVPGLYAAVLKLTQGEQATAAVDGWLYVTFACWFVSLLLTLLSLMPRQWRVDTTILQGDPARSGGTMGLEEFFQQSARNKRRLLIPSILLFAAGTLSAVRFLFS